MISRQCTLASCVAAFGRVVHSDCYACAQSCVRSAHLCVHGEPLVHCFKFFDQQVVHLDNEVPLFHLLLCLFLNLMGYHRPARRAGRMPWCEHLTTRARGRRASRVPTAPDCTRELDTPHHTHFWQIWTQVSQVRKVWSGVTLIGRSPLSSLTAAIATPESASILRQVSSSSPRLQSPPGTWSGRGRGDTQ